jgi:hypothetical protein
MRAGSLIGERGKTGRDRGNGDGVDAGMRGPGSVRVMDSDTLPAGKHTPTHAARVRRSTRLYYRSPWIRKARVTAKQGSSQRCVFGFCFPWGFVVCRPMLVFSSRFFNSSASPERVIYLCLYFFLCDSLFLFVVLWGGGFGWQNPKSMAKIHNLS